MYESLSKQQGPKEMKKKPLKRGQRRVTEEGGGGQKEAELAQGLEWSCLLPQSQSIPNPWLAEPACILPLLLLFFLICIFSE